jgi:HSP20 family protein
MVALIRRSPNGVYAVRPFFRTFNLLDEVEDMAKRAWDTTMTPRVDMYEEDNQVIVKAELPGIAKKDIDISLEDDVLTIKAEKKEETEEGDKETTHYTRERRFGQYVRRMTLPGKMDAENVTATLKKGVLEIKLPRAEEPEAKQIEINVK